MADFRFTFTVRGITLARAGAIRDRIDARLVEDGAPPGSVVVTRVTETFRVLAVDVTTREVLDTTVEAATEQDARDTFAAANPDAVVVLVRVERP